MKIAKEARIEKLVHPRTGSGRDVLKHVQIERDGSGKAVAVATDGRMLACVPVELEEGDTPGLVSIEALGQARKLARKGEMARLEANGVLILPNGATYPRPDSENLKYPNWRQVVPNEEPRFRIALSAERLLAIAEALGAKESQVVLEFTDKLSPVRVKALASDEAIGVLMPVRMS